MGRMSPIRIDPEVLSGAPCFAGTRVPVRLLFDLLAAGETVDDFLDGYPTVRPEQVQEVLRLAGQQVATAADHAA